MPNWRLLQKIRAYLGEEDALPPTAKLSQAQQEQQRALQRNGWALASLPRKEARSVTSTADALGLGEPPPPPKKSR